MIHNNVGTTLKRFGSDHHLHVPFDAIDNSTWGIDAYYFFNHKRYSEAASFNYSRLQGRSQGAFYTGFSIIVSSWQSYGTKGRCLPVLPADSMWPLSMTARLPMPEECLAARLFSASDSTCGSVHGLRFCGYLDFLYVSATSIR